MGSPTTQNPERSCISIFQVLPSAYEDRVGILFSFYFRGSIPNLHMPLSTLRFHHCGCQRMTRGHHGLLDLWCMALPSTTPCRSPGAPSPNIKPSASVRGERDEAKDEHTNQARTACQHTSGLFRNEPQKEEGGTAEWFDFRNRLQGAAFPVITGIILGYGSVYVF